MNGVHLTFLPNGQADVQITAAALPYFRGESAGERMNTLMGVLSHAYQKDGQVFSNATPEQIAQEMGMPLASVQSSLQQLEKEGFFQIIRTKESTSCLLIHA